MIRPAAFSDVPAMAAVLREAYAASIYADRATFDEREAKSLFVRALQRHGHKTPGGSFVMVAEQAGAVEGFIIGCLERVYHVLEELMATDLFFLCSARADPHDAGRLLKAFTAWAEANPRVIEIHMGVTNAMGDWTKAGRLYQRQGFTEAGALYERRVR
jgi:hypothetical protein